MTWLNHFYSTSVAVPLSLLSLAAIALLSWKKRGHQIILALTLFLYARYLLWRGLYTLNTGDWASLLVSWTVYTAEAYAFVQILLFAYHAWSPLERHPVPLRRYPNVDIFVTVVDEPLAYSSPDVDRLYHPGLSQRPLPGACARRWSARRD